MAWVLGAAAALWALVRVAPATIPDVAQTAARSALWPQRDLGEFTEFVRTSPIGQLAYRIGGALGTWEYLLVHAVAAVAAVALLAWWLARQVPVGRRGVAVRLVLLSPAAALLVVFLGSYDPFTVLGLAALLFAWAADSRWAMVAAGGYLGFQHFEQGLVVVTVASVAAYALQERPGTGSRSTPAWAYLGLVLGKVALTIVLQIAVGDGLGGRSSYLVEYWLRPALTSTVNFGPVLLLSLFAGLWALVVIGVLRLPARARVLVVLAFVLCLIPMVVAADHTRIFVMCSTVPLLMLAADVLNGSDVSRRELVIVEAMAWIVVPLFVWTSYDAGYLQHTGVYDLWVMFGQQVNSWL